MLRLETQLLVEELGTVTAESFRQIHGGIGVTKQAVRGRVIVGQDDAEAGRDGKFVPIDKPRSVDGLPNSFRNPFGLAYRDVLTDDDEFISPNRAMVSPGLTTVSILRTASGSKWSPIPWPNGRSPP